MEDKRISTYGSARPTPEVDTGEGMGGESSDLKHTITWKHKPPAEITCTYELRFLYANRVLLHVDGVGGNRFQLDEADLQCLRERLKERLEASQKADSVVLNVRITAHLEDKDSNLQVSVVKRDSLEIQLRDKVSAGRRT